MAEISNSALYDNYSTGIPSKKDACIVIVKTEWNAAIVNALESGCTQTLTQSGVRNIIVLTVPGAIEIPFAVKQFWESKKQAGTKPDAFIALGCVIRGDTPHFEYVSRAVTDGVMQLNLLLPVPVVFGVLTVDNELQAAERIGGKHGHKGKEAAITAIKMIQFLQSFNNESPLKANEE
jgi:6,7-dimethyl-8-ribityllumazine synthase